MLSFSRISLLTLLGSTLAVGALTLVAIPSANGASTDGSVCSGPNDKCNSMHKTFEPYELPFRLPAKLKDNTTYRSATFYGIVLRRYASGAGSECDGGEWTKSVENQRKQWQKLFPSQKVFASHQCPDMSAVSYNIDGQWNTSVFIAVYGGKTSAEAQKVLVKARKVNPKARLQRMNAAFERIVQ